MKTEREYINDLTEIRSMMERSSKFLSLSGWSGVLLGIYALAGAFFANLIMQRNDDYYLYDLSGVLPVSRTPGELFLLALAVLALAIATAVFLAYRRSRKLNEQFWNATSRRLLFHMLIPLLAGGILIAIVIAKGLPGFALPFMLLFYGLTLVNAGSFTYPEIKYLGIINVVLGLMAALVIGYGLLLWAVGFGIMHIIYGLYIHLRYEK